jgi:hypothetical protein
MIGDSHWNQKKSWNIKTTLHEYNITKENRQNSSDYVLFAFNLIFNFSNLLPLFSIKSTYTPDALHIMKHNFTVYSFLDLHGIGENLVGRLVISGRGHHEQATNITPLHP